MEKGKKGANPGEKNALLLEVSHACWKKGGARRRGYKVWAEERVAVSLVGVWCVEERKESCVGVWTVVWSRAVSWISLESGVSAVGEELERSEHSGAKARGLPYRA